MDRALDNVGKPNVFADSGKAFSKMAYMKKHQLTHSINKPYMCAKCDKGFGNKSNLQQHMLTHTGVKAHVCSDCGKRFAWLGNLRSHMLIHTGVKAHMCSDCGKRFAHLGNLQRHMLTHTGLKPHVCSDCGMGFTLLDTLKKHLVTHTGVKPHVCSDCGNGFSRLSSLRSHMLTHTGVKPHVCSDCGKSYCNLRNLRRHMRIHTVGHANEKIPVTATSKYKDSVAPHKNNHNTTDGCNTQDSTVAEKHLKTHVGFPSCLHCVRGFVKFSELKTHIDVSHITTSWSQCSSNNKDSVVLHENNNGTTYGHSTQESIVAERHLKTQKKFTSCLLCVRGFVQLAELKAHIDISYVATTWVECSSNDKDSVVPHVKSDKATHGRVTLE